MPSQDVIKSPDTSRAERVPPGQELTESFPVLHYGNVPKINPNEWKMRLFGLVEAERSLSIAEILSLPQARVFSDVHCVTTWSRLNNLWEGVPTTALKGLVKIKTEARFAIVHAYGGFTTNLSLQDFFAEDVLFALKHDGRPISPEHGYPVRLVVPRLYFWKSAKWVTGVEFTAEDRPGFWESHGYHNRGDPWKEERYG
ncbi:MAG: sulfite oxidase-like oxidoreductase [Methanothrix sp.]|nr:MAG: sulfite oxidase-like oxidoreductase [Methanothrix sp.]